MKESLISPAWNTPRILLLHSVAEAIWIRVWPVQWFAVESLWKNLVLSLLDKSVTNSPTPERWMAWFGRESRTKDLDSGCMRHRPLLRLRHDAPLITLPFLNYNNGRIVAQVKEAQALDCIALDCTALNPNFGPLSSQLNLKLPCVGEFVPDFLGNNKVLASCDSRNLLYRPNEHSNRLHYNFLYIA